MVLMTRRLRLHEICQPPTGPEHSSRLTLQRAKLVVRTDQLFQERHTNRSSIVYSGTYVEVYRGYLVTQSRHTLHMIVVACRKLAIFFWSLWKMVKCYRRLGKITVMIFLKEQISSVACPRSCCLWRKFPCLV